MISNSSIYSIPQRLHSNSEAKVNLKVINKQKQLTIQTINGIQCKCYIKTIYTLIETCYDVDQSIA